ncbi:hypothetical protein ACN261_32375, partial [Micromonospora sp. WMMD723]
VAESRIDPLETFGVLPAEPMPYFGWGDLPDQYGRRWDADDSESSPPQPPSRPLTDLPPLLPWWGPQERSR